MKITCDIISDLLPLYIDEVCTADSKNAVDDHLSECAECRKRLEAMSQDVLLSAPEKADIEKAKKPFKKLRLRFLFWLCFGIFCSTVILVTMDYAGVFDEIERAFYHSEAFLVENAAPTDEWVTINEYIYNDGYYDNSIVTENYLEVRGLFRKKKLDCSFPDWYKATLRILDEDGNIVVEPFEANGGTMSIPMKELKGGEKYYVQYISETGGNFAFNLH